jgi:hypothetical protein
MEFLARNARGEYPVVLHHPTDQPELYQRKGGEYFVSDDAMSWMRDHLLEMPRILVFGKWMGLYFRKEQDQFYFKFRYYKGKFQE